MARVKRSQTTSHSAASIVAPFESGPRSAVLLALLGGVVLHGAAGCRGDVRPFEPNDDFAPGRPRLTFNAGHDRAPGWSATSDSVYYSAEQLAGADTTRGALVAAPRTGGRVRLLIPEGQAEGVLTPVWLLAPAARPIGADLAFAQVQSLWRPHPADPDFVSCSPPRTAEEAARPPLQSIAIRVRAFAASGPLERGPELTVQPQGVEVDADARVSQTFDHPFQQLFRHDSSAVFRPSWSPDGERIVFSDGLRLLIWTVGEASAQPIANTEDGVWASWSPDGDWIAFTRLERVDSTDVSCVYVGQFGNLLFTQPRREYTIGRHLLTLIRPDGSESRDLGEGDEPAWSLDGDHIYFSHQGRIWRIAPNGSAREPIDDTVNGREPAVSPDGRFLAFSRLLNEVGEVVPDFEIYVLPLDIEN